MTIRGRRLARGYKVWPVGSSIAKSELYGWLRLPLPAEGEAFPPGWCHFPEHGEAGLEPHKTAEIWYFGAEEADVVIDITDHFDAKIDALKAHASQVGDGDGLADRLRERAQELATDEPFELGEAFKYVKMRR